MNTNPKRIVIAATLVIGASTIAAIAAVSSNGATPPTRGPASSSSSHPWTPNDCIRSNHGDYNACNVGNSGRGDLPYQPVDNSGGVASVRLPQHVMRVE